MDDNALTSLLKYFGFTFVANDCCRIEDALEAAGIRYDRLDGTMKRDDRTRAMDTLKHDPGCEVLLVSFKGRWCGPQPHSCPTGIPHGPLLVSYLHSSFLLYIASSRYRNPAVEKSSGGTEL